MGGNRKSLAQTCRNLLIVFLLTGIWHGANWTFILWGVWYGAFIVLEKCFKSYLPMIAKESKNLFTRVFLHIYTWIIVLLGWVLFRSNSLEQAFNYIKGLFGAISFQQEFGAGYYVRTSGWIIMGTGLLLALGCGQKLISSNSPYIHFMVDLFLWIFLLCCVIFLTAMGYNPFIYFNF